MSTLGWVHTVFGLVALVSGTGVILMVKGSRMHRTVGHVYVTSMLALNVSALLIYRLTGHFNAFHAFALFSFVNLLGGMGTVLLRRPKRRWLPMHAAFLTGSYVGVVAATAAEIVSRVPGWHFGLSVGVATLVITGIGAYLIATRMEGALKKMNHQRPETAALIREEGKLSPV